MVSAIRPEAPQIKYPNRSGLGTRGNKQRLTKDVTPLPRLEDLRQGLGMPWAPLMYFFIQCPHLWRSVASLTCHIFYNIPLVFYYILQ